MIPYFLLLLYIIFICVIIKDNKKCLFFCLIPFFLFMATQLGWTPDYEPYVAEFDIAHQDWRLSHSFLNFEFLFALLNTVLPSYRLLLFAQFGLFSIALYILFYYYIPRKFWIFAFLLYWVDYNMMLMTVSAVRSCFALSLFIIAFHLRNKSQLLIPYVLLLLSVFIHKSSIIVLLLFLTCEFRGKITTILFSSFVGAIIVLILINPDIFNYYLSDLLESSDRFASYNAYTEAKTLSLGAYLNRLLRMMCAVFLLTVFIKKKVDKDYCIYISMVLSIVLFSLLSMPNVGAVTRFCVYFGPMQLVCYSKLSSLGVGKIRYLLFGYTLSFDLYYLFLQAPNMPSWENYIHYNSILF